MIWNLTVILLVLSFVQHVYAVQVRIPESGSGKVQSIVVHNDAEERSCLKGRVLIQFENQWYFFEGKTEDGKNLLSIALAAKSMNTDVILYISDNGGACVPEYFKSIHNIVLK